jgi:hypothetical protein
MNSCRVGRTGSGVACSICACQGQLVCSRFCSCVQAQSATRTAHVAPHQLRPDSVQHPAGRLQGTAARGCPTTCRTHAGCHSPLRIPTGSLRDIAEAMVRANHRLRIGKFELDLDDGEPFFQVSQILDGDAVGETVIDRMIGTAVNMLDTYSAGVYVGGVRR